MKYKCKIERFMEDVADHKMKVVVDDKKNFIRHLTFRGNTFNCWYDLITWKGSLCINGDHGSYVFSRVDDMFTFFRSRNNTLKINASYWAEKVQSQGIYGDGIKKFSVNLFRENIKEHFQMCFDDEDIEKKQSIWEDVESDLLHCEDEYECVVAIRDFESNGFRFEDFWESSCEEYTFHYIWCLLAIVYGIQLYDKD